MGVTTLVLLPGLMCDAAVWTPLLPALQAHAECHVVAYGLRNSLTTMAQQVLDEAPTERFALAGHSMGGRVAMEVMRLAPHRVERLALLDTGTHTLAAGDAGERERPEMRRRPEQHDEKPRHARDRNTVHRNGLSPHEAVQAQQEARHQDGAHHPPGSDPQIERRHDRRVDLGGVVEAAEGHVPREVFEFVVEVDSGPVDAQVNRWGYRLEPEGDGTRAWGSLQKIKSGASGRMKLVKISG